MMEKLEIEEDKEVSEDTVKNGDIVSPFSTKDIKVTNATIALSSLINRLKHDEIDLNPDFQRNELLWDKSKMSKLVESILLKLPLPVFYFDVSDPDKWIVVDGLQRLSTLKKFIVEGKLKLSNLEFLTDLNGSSYKELDRNLQRIIDETQIVTYQIEAQTPKEVRYSIFNRINTGGLSLNAQEIRQALNQKGVGIKFLSEVCETDEFRQIIEVSSKRMLDRELVLRFIAFKLNDYKKSSFNNMGNLLDITMEKLDAIKDNNVLIKLKTDLIDTLVFSEKVLGEKHRFSRSIGQANRTKTLNRSLYDVLTVCFSNIDKKELFLQRKDIFLEKFKLLLQDETSAFSKSITEGTSSKQAIETRFEIIETLIKEVLHEQN